MDDPEAIIGLVAAGKLHCSGAARVLNVTAVEFVQLLNSHGITLFRPTADELQRELEGAASRMRNRRHLILPRLVGILVVPLGELSQGPAILHWVVQRNAKTAALITFTSFGDYADALRHRAELEANGDSFGRTNIVAIESLADSEFPK